MLSLQGQGGKDDFAEGGGQSIQKLREWESHHVRDPSRASRLVACWETE